jgi:aspartyl-tRNA(Asn)/glutamyl-tRNA(Gln) amidotransferase subunit B
VESIRKALPESPTAWRRRLVAEYALTEADASALTSHAAVGRYFEAAVLAGASPRAAAKFVMGPVRSKMNDTATEDVTVIAERVAPSALAELLSLIDSGAISHSIGKDVFDRMMATGASAKSIVDAEGLTQIDDESSLTRAIGDVLALNADAVAQFNGGKANAFGFLVGQVMKATAGKANPKRVNELLKKALGTA